MASAPFPNPQSTTLPEAARLQAGTPPWRRPAPHPPLPARFRLRIKGDQRVVYPQSAFEPQPLAIHAAGYHHDFGTCVHHVPNREIRVRSRAQVGPGRHGAGRRPDRSDRGLGGLSSLRLLRRFDGRVRQRCRFGGWRDGQPRLELSKVPAVRQQFLQPGGIAAPEHGTGGNSRHAGGGRHRRKLNGTLACRMSGRSGRRQVLSSQPVHVHPQVFRTVRDHLPSSLRSGCPRHSASGPPGRLRPAGRPWRDAAGGIGDWWRHPAPPGDRLLRSGRPPPIRATV